MPEHDAAQPTVTAIILAAGASSRMGAYKLLLPLGDSPLILRSVDAIHATAASPTVVVLGRDAERVSHVLPKDGLTVVVNPDFASGMASSLRVGLSAVPSTSQGTIVLLADQPLVTPALINTILAVAATNPQAIIAATFGGQRGHPVYFPKSLFAELMTVQGDEGGKSVIARHRDALRLVEWPDSAAGIDIDTEEEYARVQAIWAARDAAQDR